MIVEDFVCELLERRRLQRWCRNKVIFRLKGDKEFSWRTIDTCWSDKVKNHLRNKFGKELEEIANERFV